MKQLLPFKVAYETYALELPFVQEVVEQCRIDPFPGAPQVVAGAIAFHGRIIPVVSLPQVLGFTDSTLGERLIVLTNDWGPVALGAAQVGSILSIDNSEFKTVQNYSRRKYIRDVVSWRGAMIGLLDLDRLRSELERLCDLSGGNA